AATDPGDRADDEADPRAVRVDALSHLGVVLRVRGQQDECRRCHEEALQLARDEHDLVAQARALMELALAAQSQGRRDEARARIDDAAAIADRHALDPLRAQISQARGAFHYASKEYQEAEAAFARAHRLFRRAGDGKGSTRALNNLGLIH